jgi:hypothetical protein
MKTLALAAAAAFIGAGASSAQPAAPQPPAVPPRVFLAAGYGEPDITPGFCRNIDTTHTQCTIPAMTAGRYLVTVGGTSTAAAAGAVQQITIQAGDQRCTSTRNPDPQAPWAIGQKRTFYSACLITVITDVPLAVNAFYADAKATKDPRGPVLSVGRQPWVGVIAALPVQVRQQ